MKVRIMRRIAPVTEPYWESFDYDGPEDTSVAGLLDYINYHDDIINDEQWQYIGMATVPHNINRRHLVAVESLCFIKVSL